METNTLASTRVSYAQTATVFHNAQQLSPDPTFALKAGALMHVTKYGTYGYALLRKVCTTLPPPA